MKKKILTYLLAFILLGFVLLVSGSQFLSTSSNKEIKLEMLGASEIRYWFLLKRKSNIEEFYQGVPGDIPKSTLVKTFKVKVGIPGERPTPLPQLLGREYWILTKKAPSENPETSPYFLTLNVPTSEEEPFGPVPYLECNGQCNWVTPGEFGLHGTGGNSGKLSESDPGSSGCIRHSDQDITYLYNLLNPENEEIRYYIKDI